MNALEESILFSQTLVGRPYGAWDGDTIGEGKPFYASNAPVPSSLHIPTVSCAGLANLMRRHARMPVPGVAEQDPYAAWKQYLLAFLVKFDVSTTYPRGTLLLREYTNEADQGHVAIVTGPGTIIHAAPPCVREESLSISHAWCAQGYYQWACSPDHWLSRPFDKN